MTTLLLHCYQVIPNASLATLLIRSQSNVITSSHSAANKIPPVIYNITSQQMNTELLHLHSLVCKMLDDDNVTAKTEQFQKVNWKENGQKNGSLYGLMAKLNS